MRTRRPALRTYKVVGPKYEMAGPKYEAAGPKYEAAGPKYEAAGPTSAILQLHFGPSSAFFKPYFNPTSALLQTTWARGPPVPLRVFLAKVVRPAVVGSSEGRVGLGFGGGAAGPR